VHLKGVAEMTSKDRFPNHETICGQCGTTIYKPFKELSDDEIMELAEYHGINDWLYETSVTDFARAILKRASEK
jgi:tRNA(Ile)-lysidine synthase TilS/MesJ